jgi:Holliday junction resolvase RusA-like endonuclease
VQPVSFTVPGEPRGKGRPRATITAGHARTYTDAKTEAYESLVRLAAAAALGDRLRFDEALALTLVIRMEPAASASGRKRLAMLAGTIRPTKLPDADNVLKAVLDGCNKVAFRDDALVVQISVSKVYAAIPGLDVTIAPVGPLETAASALEAA